ncbi:DUF4387 family protein [Breznakiella homolactica]|uniref:DUF4387 domain-containing protein n=1 Tax=Breznakiella homolactica TaxID=2798577 RepID=A0A7T8BCE0_9SPIR|nr:DUF4387 family protein [Breznakiella homolactica]QQO10158.1 DUF4387 domain-containing protein [Breznakiella homolactica]
MATIYQTAKYIRSKSAGPFWFTIDIFCDGPERFAEFKNSKNIRAETFARIYGAEPDQVKLFFVPDINVIKISIPRKNPQGYRYEKDMHGGQQYTLILDVEL